MPKAASYTLASQSLSLCVTWGKFVDKLYHAAVQSLETNLSHVGETHGINRIIIDTVSAWGDVITWADMLSCCQLPEVVWVSHQTNSRETRVALERWLYLWRAFPMPMKSDARFFFSLSIALKARPHCERRTFATVGKGRKMYFHVRFCSRSQMFAQHLPTVFRVFLVARKFWTCWKFPHNKKSTSERLATIW